MLRSLNRWRIVGPPRSTLASGMAGGGGRLKGRSADESVSETDRGEGLDVGGHFSNIERAAASMSASPTRTASAAGPSGMKLS